MQRRSFIKSLAASSVLGGVFDGRATLVPGRANVAFAAIQNADANVPGTQAPRPTLFYQPKGGRVGDVIPFHDGEQFRIFHLFEADGERGLTSWQQVSTTDFVHFTKLGTMLPRGSSEDQDRSVATGSVIKDRSGRFHIFYTGFADRKTTHKPEQGVMHAVSEDLTHWRKVPSDTFYAPTTIYERDDWRDPFVFWNEDAGEYWMLVAARLRSGPSRRRGSTALCTSKDLTNWKVGEPFWAPGLFYTHECPDLFKMGAWWYLIFSEFSESSQTRYRMSRNLAGPWIAPQDDVFDCRALYAAKSVSDGRTRYLCGWNPFRSAGSDTGKWEWGGTLVIHELRQRKDGELFVVIPQGLQRSFTEPLPLDMRSAVGNCEIVRDQVRINSRSSFSIAIAGRLLRTCRVSLTCRFDQHTRAFGLMLRLSNDLDTCYYLRFEPSRERMVLDQWLRPGDVPYITGFERPLQLQPGKPLSIEIVLDGTIAEIYVNEEVAMSARFYKQDSGQLGLFVDEGAATFDDIRIQSRPSA
jgi:beta-fructofuranosidase